MEELISIIVPVYNVESYLEECVQSIIQQSYRNIEIILIDDGSTDNSGILCDKYAMQDQRIKVIHKENGGLSEARNYGMKEASGDWFLFVDSDDFIRRDSCEILIKYANKFLADIVIAREKKFLDGCTFEYSDLSGVQYLLDSDQALQYYFYRKFAGYACGKLLKKSIIKDIAFPRGKYFEDSFVLFLFLEKANKVAVLQDEVYFYRQRKSSIINSNCSKKHLDIIEANQIAENYFKLKHENKEIMKAIQSKKFISSVDILGRIPLSKEWKLERKKLIQVIKETRKIVLKDSNNSFLVRIMAFLSYINPLLLAMGTKVRGVVNLKRM